MTAPAEFDPARGDVFLDARGNGRAMRLSWHPEADVVVLSLWREDLCAGTFRMPHEDVAAFIDALIDSLRDAPGVHLPPSAANTPRPAADPAGPGDTQAMPAQSARIGFADWAFERSATDGHATAS